MATHEIINRREEKNFFKLFYQVLAQMQEYECPASDYEIRYGIEKAIDSFRGGPQGACAVSKFRNYGDLLGYFYWSSPVSAGVTRNKALIALEHCDEFRSCFNQPDLKMASIGGGTGSDLVGLYSALYEYSEFRKMEVLVIENNRHWEPFFYKVQQELFEGNFGYASHLINSTTSMNPIFIRADMRYPLPRDLRSELGSCHIVWMKGVQSILNNFERQDVIQNVISAISPGSLLVVLDSRAYDNFDSFSDQLERIFSTAEEHPYYLEPCYGYDELQFCRRTNQEISIFIKK